MKYYWINCALSTDRRHYMNEQFSKLKLDNKRVEACTPYSLPVVIKPDGCKESDFEIACLCSHMKALQMGLDSGEDRFVVLEDDVKIMFDIDYDSMVKEADRCFSVGAVADIVQMFTSTPKYKDLHNKYINGELFIEWSCKMYGTCSYMITKAGAEKIINKFIKDRIFDFSKFDGRVTADTILYKSVVTIVSTYPMFYNNNKMYKSIIHNKHNKYHIMISKIAKRMISNIECPKYCKKL